MKKYPYEVDGVLKQGHRAPTFHTIMREMSEEMVRRRLLIYFPNLIILRVKKLEQEDEKLG